MPRNKLVMSELNIGMPEDYINDCYPGMMFQKQL